MKASGISPQGLQVWLATEESYKQYKADEEAGKNLWIETLGMPTLTNDTPEWTHKVETAGRYVIMFYQSFADSIAIEKL